MPEGEKTCTRLSDVVYWSITCWTKLMHMKKLWETMERFMGLGRAQGAEVSVHYT